MKASGVGHLMCMEEVRNAYTIFIGECEWKRPHGRLWAYILRADF
jgi:hypothetical protein